MIKWIKAWFGPKSKESSIKTHGRFKFKKKTERYILPKTISKGYGPHGIGWDYMDIITDYECECGCGMNKVEKTTQLM